MYSLSTGSASTAVFFQIQYAETTYWSFIQILQLAFRSRSSGTLRIHRSAFESRFGPREVGPGFDRVRAAATARAPGSTARSMMMKPHESHPSAGAAGPEGAAGLVKYYTTTLNDEEDAQAPVDNRLSTDSDDRFLDAGAKNASIDAQDSIVAPLRTAPNAKMQAVSTTGGATKSRAGVRGWLSRQLSTALGGRSEKLKHMRHTSTSSSSGVVGLGTNRSDFFSLRKARTSMASKMRLLTARGSFFRSEIDPSSKEWTGTLWSFLRWQSTPFRIVLALFLLWVMVVKSWQWAGRGTVTSLLAIFDHDRF